jgi:hypothetical protein
MYIRVCNCTFVQCSKTHFGSTEYSNFNFNKRGAYLFKCFAEDKSKMVKIPQQDYDWIAYSTNNVTRTTI